MEAAGPAIFVGRRSELGLLEAALQDAHHERTRFVLISGEAGIGKTRLAMELSAIAEASGARVSWGRCWDGEGSPAYWPFVQVFRALGQPLVVPSAIAEEARFALLDSAVLRLSMASSTGTQVLVLDDLHWADGASLLLLKLLARTLTDARLLVVGTVRDVDARMRRAAACER